MLHVLSIVHLHPVARISRPLHGLVQLSEQAVLFQELVYADIEFLEFACHLLSVADVHEHFLHQVFLILVMQKERVVCILDVVCGGRLGLGLLLSPRLRLCLILLFACLLLINNLKNLGVPLLIELLNGFGVLSYLPFLDFIR